MDEVKSYLRLKQTALWRGLLVLVLLFQFAGFVSVFSAHIDPRSLLSARDADGAHIVGTANATRWYKDNGETAYGALFYRISESFSAVARRDFANLSSPVENNERAQHLVLMTLSLLCVFAIAFLISQLVVEGLEFKLLSTAALTALFLSNATWATFVFRAHPDMLFGLFVLGAFLFTSLMLDQPNDRKWFYLSALMWGLCGMVKLTFIIFLPAAIFLWIPPLRRENLQKLVKFYLWMLPGYLLAGFPQSFNFPRSIRFLIQQSQFNEPMTAESLGRWGRDIVGQTTWPLIAILIFALVSSRAPQRRVLRLLPFVLLPTLVIVRQNSIYRADYYLIPVVCMFLAWVCISLRGRLSFPKNWRMGRVVPIGFFAVIWLTVGLVPQTMEAELGPTLICRQDALRVYDRIHQEMDRGIVFLLDPYVPFDKTRARDRGVSTWSNTWGVVAKTHATGIALNLSMAAKYLGEGEPAHNVQVDSPNWPEVRDYYRSFQQKSATVDPSGGKWKRVEASSCGNEIWLKDGD